MTKLNPEPPCFSIYNLKDFSGRIPALGFQHLTTSILAAWAARGNQNPCAERVACDSLLLATLNPKPKMRACRCLALKHPFFGTLSLGGARVNHIAVGVT